MADRVRSARKRNRRRMPADQAPISIRLRKLIAEALQQPGLKVRQVSQLELAIGTFAPSTVVKGYVVSDYPFPMCRYVSAADGHVYHVKGPTDDGEEIIAYRQGFLTSLFSSRGGIGVSINDEGWMGARMIMYSLSHMHFDMKGGVLNGINDEWTVRRSYPGKRFGAYVEFLRRQIVRWPLVQNIVALCVRESKDMGKDARAQAEPQHTQAGE
jgi:hypothetical protein